MVRLLYTYLKKQQTDWINFHPTGSYTFGSSHVNNFLSGFSGITKGEKACLVKVHTVSFHVSNIKPSGGHIWRESQDGLEISEIERKKILESEIKSLGWFSQEVDR